MYLNIIHTTKQRLMKNACNLIYHKAEPCGSEWTSWD